MAFGNDLSIATQRESLHEHWLRLKEATGTPVNGRRPEY